MQLTQITVSYGGTQSLPDYSNVRVSVTLTATLDHDDGPAGVEALLWQQAKETIHEQIDRALESEGRPAKHSTEPRYQVMQTYRNHWRAKDDPAPLPPMVVILPNEATIADRRFVHVGGAVDCRRQRLGAARQIASLAAHEMGAQLIDCSDGDLLPIELILASIDEAAAMQREADHDDLLVSESESHDDSAV